MGNSEAVSTAPPIVNATDKEETPIMIDCSDCGASVKEEESVSVTGRRHNDVRVCSACSNDHYFSCHDCEVIFHEDYAITSENSTNTYCVGCASECRQCGYSFHSADDESGEGYCRDCQPSNDDDDSEGGSVNETNTVLGKYLDVRAVDYHADKRLPVGIELEVAYGSCDGSDITNAVQPRSTGDGIHRDGSVDGMGLEIVTAPRYVEDAADRVKELAPKLRGLGFKPNNSCGTHVHFGLGNADRNDRHKLAVTYYAIEPLLMALVPESRRRNNYCLSLTLDMGRDYEAVKTASQSPDDNQTPLVTPRDLNNIERYEYALKEKGLGPRSKREYLQAIADVRANAERRGRDLKNADLFNDRYRAVNFTAYGKHGTVEIRLHSGTLDSEKMRHWLRLNHAIIDAARFRFAWPLVDTLAAASKTIMESNAPKSKRLESMAAALALLGLGNDTVQFLTARYIDLTLKKSD